MLEARSPVRLTLSQRAYEAIKEALCQGKFSPGDILSESQLAAQLGMSRTPVREALRTLASEDWLEIRNGIGAYVKPLSAKDIEDLYEVRCLLEVQAARTAVSRITEEEIDSLEERFRALLAECGEGGSFPDPGRFSALDWELHELIVERCQNHYIRSIMANNNAIVKRYQLLSVEALNDIRESTRQHLEILDCLRRRNGEELAETLRRHLTWAAGLLERV